MTRSHSDIEGDAVGEKDQIRVVTRSHRALGDRVGDKVGDKVGEKVGDKAASMS